MFISDGDVRRVLTFPDAVSAIEDAFRDFGRSESAVQERVRVASDDTSLSMMGAICPGAGLSGAKIYTTRDGRFDFVLALFSHPDGRFAATMEGNALTEFRTAATTVVAARYLARSDAEVLAVFGTGIQGQAHIEAFLTTGSFEEVLVIGRRGADDCAAWVQSRFAISARVSEASDAVRRADVIVTATRAKEALFSGAEVKPGCFVAAIGSSKPDAREIDGELLSRAGRIVVEWKPQAAREAGDLILADPALDWSRVQELGAIVARGIRRDAADRDVVVFKSVGIALADVALAGSIMMRVAS